MSLCNINTSILKKAISKDIYLPANVTAFNIPLSSSERSRSHSATGSTYDMETVSVIWVIEGKIIQNSKM